MGCKKKNEEPVVEAEKPWVPITQHDLDITTDEEMKKGTNRCRPPIELVPKGMFDWENPYHRMADALYCGESVPEYQITIHPGFTGDKLAVFIMAHVVGLEPEYEYKIASAAYLLSLVITIESMT